MAAFNCTELFVLEGSEGVLDAGPCRNTPRLIANQETDKDSEAEGRTGILESLLCGDVDLLVFFDSFTS